MLWQINRSSRVAGEMKTEVEVEVEVEKEEEEEDKEEEDQSLSPARCSEPPKEELVTEMLARG